MFTIFYIVYSDNINDSRMVNAVTIMKYIGATIARKSRDNILLLKGFLIFFFSFTIN